MLQGRYYGLSNGRSVLKAEDQFTFSQFSDVAHCFFS